jgi:uroporphyrinogen-III synthase
VAAFPDPQPGEGNLVLFPCADLAPSTVPDALVEKGWEVRRVEAYRTVPLAPPDPEVLMRLASSDAVIFAAPSAAEAYADLSRPDGSSLGAPPVIVCIGPSTAARARALGMTGVVQSPGPASEQIVAALAHGLADRGV